MRKGWRGWVWSSYAERLGKCDDSNRGHTDRHEPGIRSKVKYIGSRVLVLSSVGLKRTSVYSTFVVSYFVLRSDCNLTTFVHHIKTRSIP